MTEADRAAELVILAALARAAPGVPVIAEEEVAAGRIPAHGDIFFLVDPLDGTKEFVRGGDDYTVNIGLIEGGAPTLGVVFAPATGVLHAGTRGRRRLGRRGTGARRSARVQRGEELTAVASKSHLNQATIDYLEAAVGACGYVSVGSSLKFCILAEGQADIYPRASPTSEWDTAAGHAVLLAAGGLVDGPGRDAVALWQARLSQSRVRRDQRLEAAAARALSRAFLGRRRPPAGRLGAAILDLPVPRQRLASILDQDPHRRRSAADRAAATGPAARAASIRAARLTGFAGVARARRCKPPEQSLRFLQSVGKIGQPARTLGRRYITRYSNHIVPRSFDQTVANLTRS